MGSPAPGRWLRAWRPTRRGAMRTSTITRKEGQRGSALRTGVLWVATLVAGTWIGSRITQTSPPHAMAPAPATRSAAAGPFVVDASGALDAAAVRRIIRDELAQQLSELRRPPSEPVAADRAPDPPPLSIELQARSDEAAGVIERAVRAGRWTGDDRRQFANATAALPPPTVFELQRSLHVAINRGQVALADGAAPFDRAASAP